MEIEESAMALGAELQFVYLKYLPIWTRSKCACILSTHRRSGHFSLCAADRRVYALFTKQQLFTAAMFHSRERRNIINSLRKLRASLISCVRVCLQ